MLTNQCVEDDLFDWMTLISSSSSQPSPTVRHSATGRPEPSRPGAEIKPEDGSGSMKQPSIVIDEAEDVKDSPGVVVVSDMAASPVPVPSSRHSSLQSLHCSPCVSVIVSDFESPTGQVPPPL